jgi:hypothetical protein
VRRTESCEKIVILQHDLATLVFPSIATTIVSFHTLEHIQPDRLPSTMKHFYGALRPDGNLVISVPYQKAYDNPAHLSYFSVSDIRSLCESSGFVTVECYRDRTVDLFGNRHDCITGLFRKAAVAFRG